MSPECLERATNLEPDWELFNPLNKVYKCSDGNYLSIDKYLASKVDEVLEGLQQTGLMGSAVKDERIIFVTYPSGRKIEICFDDIY